MLARRLLIAGGGGSFVMPPTLYCLYNGSQDAVTYAIGAASSTDLGLTWSVNAGNPVLQVGAGGSWDDSTVKDPWLFWDGSQFVIYASGYDGSNYRIGRWTATTWANIEAGTITPDSNPIIGISAATFRSDGVIFPTVLYEPTDTGKEEKIWFTGYDGSKWRIGYAYRSGGVVTVVGQVLDVGSGGDWDDEGVVSAAIYKSGSTYYLYYGGTSVAGGSQNWQGGVATFTDPEGTYTKSGSNPSPTYRSGDSPFPGETLSANTNAGSAIVQIPDTSAFNQGEAIVLFETSSVQMEVHRIASIDSGTQLTMASTATGSFTTGHSSGIRTFAMNSVQPRAVLSDNAGGYIMFGAVFQPVADLGSIGGTKLREGSLRWTSSALDGPWAYDYTAIEPLFPMYPATTGWDEFSAENPSVIVAP